MGALDEMEPANITHLHEDNKSSPAGEKKKEAAFQHGMAGELRAAERVEASAGRAPAVGLCA